MGSCCAHRTKFEDHFDEEYRILNQLPTYENISTVYNELELPKPSQKYLPHKKERMLFMIINLLRAKPKIFMQQINNFRMKCNMRQKPKNLVFVAEDVEAAIDMLASIQPTHPLELSYDLCQLCRESKQQFYSLYNNNRPKTSKASADPGISTIETTDKEPETQNNSFDAIEKEHNSRTQRTVGQFNFKGIKEMVIDFICREDLVITTLKEFFEIFISSIKKEQIFHSELLSSQYKYVGISMEFNAYTSVATLRLFLAQSLDDVQ